MRAIRLIGGDSFRYRGKRYRVHGTCKLWNPVCKITVSVTKKGETYDVNKPKWMTIPGEHTVILEKRRGEPRGSWD